MIGFHSRRHGIEDRQISNGGFFGAVCRGIMSAESLKIPTLMYLLESLKEQRQSFSREWIVDSLKVYSVNMGSVNGCCHRLNLQKSLSFLEARSMLMVSRQGLIGVLGIHWRVSSGHQEEFMNVLVGFQREFRYC